MDRGVMSCGLWSRVPPPLLLRSLEAAAELREPLVRRQRVRCARCVREGALPREGVMHPLRKEAAMERHETSIVRSDVVEALEQLHRKVARCLDGIRGQGGHEAREERRGRDRRSDMALEVRHKTL